MEDRTDMSVQRKKDSALTDAEFTALCSDVMAWIGAASADAEPSAAGEP